MQIHPMLPEILNNAVFTFVIFVKLWQSKKVESYSYSKVSSEQTSEIFPILFFY